MTTHQGMMGEQQRGLHSILLPTQLQKQWIVLAKQDDPAITAAIRYRAHAANQQVQWHCPTAGNTRVVLG
jgi:hypothetical protein